MNLRLHGIMVSSELSDYERLLIRKSQLYQMIKEGELTEPANHVPEYSLDETFTEGTVVCL